MSRTKKISIGVGLCLLAGLYVYVYGDRFKPAQVQIFHRVTMSRAGRFKFRKPTAPAPPQMVVAFGFDRKLKLTDVKVVPVAALATNKNPLPVWHLVSDSNSVPVKALLYGDFIRGMVPAVKGTFAQPLETNQTYRLLIKSDSGSGQHDFTYSKPAAAENLQ